MNDAYDEMTPEQKEAEARRRAEESKARRKFCDALGFWQFCWHKRCRRAMSCQIEDYPCFDVFWPEIPEDDKEYIRTFIKVAVANPELSGGALIGAVDAELKRRKDIEAEFAALRAQQTAPPAAEKIAPAAEKIQPAARIRTL